MHLISNYTNTNSVSEIQIQFLMAQVSSHSLGSSLLLKSVQYTKSISFQRFISMETRKKTNLGSTLPSSSYTQWKVQYDESGITRLLRKRVGKVLGTQEVVPFPPGLETGRLFLVVRHRK
ncbi:hypothetical protein ILYODFUR_038042 [Ilyodon furcidens]|uniref:Uncharacterized protein n=1 Tax=Ilyodon furcidens TaxID=33524 RepID=A0ABV0UNX9_9TELE